MGAYLELTAVGVPTREAASLTGLARASATRAAARARRPDQERAAARPAPANKLTTAERVVVLATLNSDEFIDKPPLQVYAILQGARRIRRDGRDDVSGAAGEHAGP